MKIIKVLLSSVFSLFVCSATAGVTEGKISYLFVYTGNETISFGMQSANPNFAVCAKQSLYIFSTATPQGKNIYSAVLAAKLSGQAIQIVGAGTCNAAPNAAEDVLYIALL